MSPRFRYAYICVIGFALTIAGAVGLSRNASAYIGDMITLTQLGEVEDLSSVTGVTISYEDDLSLTERLKDCTNLQYLGIGRATIDDMTFINEIIPEGELELHIGMGYYDFNGVSNPRVTILYLNASYVKNFAAGMDFPNAKTLRYEHVSGYEDLDYTHYPLLESLSLAGEAVSDYQAFFEQLKTLPNLRSLNLEGTNIDDEDTVYLKTLDNITGLNLAETSISDLSFLAEMEQIEGLGPSLDAEDLNVIRQLPNLRYVYWVGAEQLSVDDELYQYIEEHNIGHFKYEPTLKATIEQMAAEVQVDEGATVKEKVEAVIDYMTQFIISHDMFYDDEYTSNSLLYSVHYRTAVCHDYSILEHALLKELGVQAHYIAGLIPVHIRERSASFYSDELKYELAGHAWLMAQDEEGIWYGWDPVQIDIYIYDGDTRWTDTAEGKRLNFWKNPYEDDPYPYEDYLNGIYDTYNFNFALRRVVTSKIGYDDYLAQKAVEPSEFTVNFVTNGAGEIPAQVVAKGASVTEPATPVKDGFDFGGWYEKPDFSQSFHFEKMILKDTTVYAKWNEKQVDPTPPMYYYVTDGNGQSYYHSGDGLTFHINGDLSDFRDVAIDGLGVDDTFYTLAEGSTVVTLKPELLELLEPGIHTVDFFYENGGTEAVFRVASTETVPRSAVPDDTLYACMVENYGWMYGLSLTAEDTLSEEELASIRFLPCMSGEEIADLTGLEMLEELEQLTIIPTKLTAEKVDLSANKKLRNIMLGEVAESMSVLDLSANTELEIVDVAFSKNLKRVILASDNKINELRITSTDVWDEDDGPIEEGKMTVALNPRARLEKINDDEYALPLTGGFSFLKRASTMSSSGAPMENEEFSVGDTKCYVLDEDRIIIKTACLSSGELEEVKITHAYDIIDQRFTNKFTLAFLNPFDEFVPDGDISGETDDEASGEASDGTSEIETPDTGFATKAGDGVTATSAVLAVMFALLAVLVVVIAI